MFLSGRRAVGIAHQHLPCAGVLHLQSQHMVSGTCARGLNSGAVESSAFNILSTLKDTLSVDAGQDCSKMMGTGCSSERHGASAWCAPMAEARWRGKHGVFSLTLTSPTKPSDRRTLDLNASYGHQLCGWGAAGSTMLQSSTCKLYDVITSACQYCMRR
jgi:hypothetical protein